ncbi:MAG: Rap1a/Tai family immunity protein, partial [Sphingobium sp.]
VAAAQPAIQPGAPPMSAPEAAPPAPPAPPAADIGYLSAGMLVDRCSETSSASTSYCFAYIAGVSDAMRAYEIWLNTREFCPPAGQSQSDLRRAFVGFVSAYPSNRTGQAASVVVVSLKQTFPCGPDPVAPAPAPPVPSSNR